MTGRRGVRMVLALRYPYKVFYRVRGEAVEILHVRHASRRPWVGRQLASGALRSASVVAERIFTEGLLAELAAKLETGTMRQRILKGVTHPIRSAERLAEKLWISYAKRFYPDDYVGIPGNRGLSETKYYVSFVTKAAQDYKVFARFKSDGKYRAVLEHVSPELGAYYLSMIRKQTPELLSNFDRFKLNDIVGAPFTHTYPEIGECSPTTLRYVKVASDLKTYFGLDIGSNIAEIGVGYGGQLLVNDQVFSMREYHLYDIPPVLGLVERYLECHILNCSYKTTTLNQSTGSNFDLAISNCAFSELPPPLQHKYIDKVLSQSRRGYLTMNSGREGSIFAGHLSIDELKRRLPKFEIIEDDIPNSYIIVWRQ